MRMLKYQLDRFIGWKSSVWYSDVR